MALVLALIPPAVPAVLLLVLLPHILLRIATITTAVVLLTLPLVLATPQITLLVTPQIIALLVIALLVIAALSLCLAIALAPSV